MLISGDVYDQANPSTEDQKIYYNFLKSLHHSHTSVIVTGGNHDSPKTLNVSKDILDLLDIKVIGGATQDIKDEIIEIKNSAGKIELIVCAVPYLPDRDLRKIDSDHKEDRIEKIREGIKNHYR